MSEPFTILICDDEPATRTGLRDSFNWQALGIKVVGIAANGEEALDIVSRENPDIILSDVRMPIMDGLEMAGLLGKMGFAGKLVFMSAYGEVEYLKAAMRVEAIDYILKPIAISDLREAMGRVIHHIETERRRDDLYIRSLGLLRERFVLRLSMGDVGGTGDLQAQISDMELAIQHDEDIVALVASPDDPMQGWSQAPQLMDSWRRFFDKDDRVPFATLANGDLIGLVPLAEIPRGDTQAIGEALRERLGESSRGSVTIAHGPVVHALDEFHHSVYLARQALARRSLIGPDQVIPPDDYGETSANGYCIDEIAASTMAEALRSADSSMVEETLRRIFPINLGSIQMENPRGLVLRLLLTFDQIARELGLADADQFLSERQFSLIATLSRQAQAQAFLLSEGRRFCEAVRQRSLGSSRQAVEKVRHLVRQRCKEGISIKELAGEVFLTSTYLCMLFKQETGETIKDYQTRIRIERAKELLADLKLKTYEVCFEVGYSDPGYFAQTFKRFTGMSPTEYRDRKPGLR